MNGKRMGGGRGQRRGIKKVGKIRGCGRKQETKRGTWTLILSFRASERRLSPVYVVVYVPKTVNKCHRWSWQFQLLTKVKLSSNKIMKLRNVGLGCKHSMLISSLLLPSVISQTAGGRWRRRGERSAWSRWSDQVRFCPNARTTDPLSNRILICYIKWQYMFLHFKL